MARPVKYHTEEERRIARNLRETLRRKKNLEKSRAYYKEYASNNKETIKQNREKWYSKNREKVIKYNVNYCREREQVDENYKFIRYLRKVVFNSFKRNKKFNKDSKTEQILGCSLEFLINYILNLAPKGVQLKDFGKFGYHIDHIVPLSSASSKEEIEKLNHYTNLQPLWWEDNLRKSNKTLNYEL